MNQQRTFEILYDQYSSMVYTIALEVSASDSEAEAILLSTFQEAYAKYQLTNLLPGCSDFIRMTFQVIQKQFTATGSIRLSAFKSSPVIHHVFCSATGLDGYCDEHHVTREVGLKLLREEFNQLRSASSGITNLPEPEQMLPAYIPIPLRIEASFI